MPRHGISRQRQPSSSGSTPHDRVSSPQICLSRSLPLDWPRQSALRFPADISNRPTVHDVRRDPPLIHEPLHRRTTCWIGSTPITHLARDSQISIAPAARFYVPPARFPPLEAFGRRPPNTRRRPSSGRHPKPFTKTEVAALRRDVCFAPVSGHRQAVPACPKSAGLLPRRKNRRLSRDCCVFRSKPVSDTRTAWSNSSLPSTGLNLRMTRSVKSSGCFLKRASRDDPHHHYACNKARSPCESGWARNATPSSHTPRK